MTPCRAAIVSPEASRTPLARPPETRITRSTSAPQRISPPLSPMSRSNAASSERAPPTAIGQPASSTAKAINLTICAE
jgi:hypothetical protein